MSAILTMMKEEQGLNHIHDEDKKKKGVEKEKKVPVTEVIRRPLVFYHRGVEIDARSTDDAMTGLDIYDSPT